MDTFSEIHHQKPADRPDALGDSALGGQAARTGITAAAGWYSPAGNGLVQRSHSVIQLSAYMG